MKDWTKEVEEYKEKIKGIDEDEVYDFLWSEYRAGKLSKRAHDWLVRWI